MSAPYPYRYVLRASIQFTTPFLVGAGRGDDVADAIFVSDANGLPALPGSSLAGVLRALFRKAYPSEERELFGFQDVQDDQDGGGTGSRLSVSWGVIHDSQNRPVVGIVPASRLVDPVLARAQAPTLRDHVRLDHRGASDAEERGKFDEQALCAGHRFTFELEMIGGESEAPLWTKLLDLLASPGLRLGGKTRRGYGAFRFVDLASRVFDLTDKEDFEAYGNHPLSLDEPSQMLSPLSLPEKTKEAELILQLEPEGYWMIGGGCDLSGEADMAPFRDGAIAWEGDRGVICDDIVVIPATSVKGALSHRVAFHYNALKGVFADTIETSDGGLTGQVGENNLAVRELFGYCKDSTEKESDRGRRGRVLIDDIYLLGGGQEPSQQVHHVGIDRFTGGARDQVLFSERPFWKGAPITVAIGLVDTETINDRQKVLLALKRSVEDLACGRLPIGAGSGRGLGRFRSRDAIRWPLAMTEKEG